MVLVVLPLSLRDAVNHGPFHFLVDFQNADPDPVSYPDYAVHVSAKYRCDDFCHLRMSLGSGVGLA
jgi:hypothetical protein